MSANTDYSTGRAGFANDTGKSEWWGMPGAVIQPGDSLQTKLEKGGLDFKVLAAEVSYVTQSGQVRGFENRVALYRDDTEAPLGFVSKNRYKVHQNDELVSVFDKALGSRLVTIGSLEGGRSVFACATVDASITAPDGSALQPYVTIHTRHDAGGATVLADAATRPVCSNTLRMVLDEAAKAKRDYRCNHSIELDAEALAKAFGLLGKRWQQKQEDWNRIAGKRFNDRQAHAFFAALLDINLAEIGKTDRKGNLIVSTKATNQLEALFDSYKNAPGAHVGDGWGVLQAVTHYVDHKSIVRDSYGDGEEKARILSSQFGAGAALKDFAEAKLMELVAA